MERQRTFADLECHHDKKTTRREAFLGKMDSIVPWPGITGLIKPHCHGSRTGRPPIPLEAMLRMYFLQVWFSLSDEGLEDSIYDSKAFIAFMGVSIDSIPDATSLCNFRKLVNENRLGEEIMDLVSELMHKNGLIMQGGTIVDATIHEAPKSTRNKNGERDPEMASTKKHGSWHFGAKSHIGVDAGTGLVHSVEVTPANVHDSNAATQLIRPDDDSFTADSGYVGLDKRPEVADDPHLSSMEYRIAKRPSFWKKRELSKVADEFDRREERRAISIRQKVEYVFHVVKDIFRFRKLPYKGIAKNRTRLLFSYASANLYMLAIAGRRLCPLPG